MAQRNRGSRNRNSRPKPSPKPSPRSQARSKASASRSRNSNPSPAPRPSRSSTQRASRPGSVAANRAAGTNKAAVNQRNRNSSRNNQGGGNSLSGTRQAIQPVSPMGPVQNNKGGRQGNRNTSNMTVGERRADARDRNMTMRQYRAFTQDPQATNKQTPEERRNANRSLINQDVSKASDYDFGAFRKNTVNNAELRHLRKAGMSRDDIAQAVADSGLRLGKAAKNKLGRWEDRKNNTDDPVIPDTEPVETFEPGVGDTYNEYITNNYYGPEVQPTPSPTAPPGPGTSPIPPTNPIVPPTPPTVPSVVMPTPGVFPGIPGGGGPGAPTLPTFDGSFSVGGDLDQNVGKQGDMTTTIGNDNTFGAGSSIGNDMSVTIGVNQAGNNNGGFGGAMGGPYNPLSSMQSAAAYGVLNTNAWHRSQAQLNGYGRAAGASSEAARITGAPQRVSNLYNFAGQTQNYWNNKATAQQGFYLGDMFNFQAPNWQMPPDPKLPEDETEEIADSMSF